LARVVVVAMAIGLCVAAIATIAVLVQVRTANVELADIGPVAPDRLAAVDERLTALSRAIQLVDLVGVGLLAVWTRRLYGNLRHLGFNELRFREVWALGGWFVPLVNLVRPKQILNDIWRSGEPEPRPVEACEQQPVSNLLHWWWFFWIVLWLPTPFLGVEATSRLGEKPDSSFFAWCGVGHMIFGALTIAVVVRTTSRQVRLARPSSRPSSRKSLHLQLCTPRSGSRDVR
jgi:hypothetical protein